MKTIFAPFIFFSFCAALWWLSFAAVPARAEKAESRMGRITVMVDQDRELFALGDFARLDAAMNEIQLGYEKGQWTDVELLKFFERSVSVKAPEFEALFDKWVAAYPKSYAAHFARGAYRFGQALKYLGAAEQSAQLKHYLALSVEDNTSALSLTAKPILAYLDLIALYALSGDFNKSKEMLDRANQVEPRNVIARYQYMVVLSQMRPSLAEVQKLADEVRGTKRNGEEISSAMQLYYARLFGESRWDILDKEINQAQKDYEAGKINDETLEYYFSMFFSADGTVEKKLDAWVRAYPNSYAALQARCSYLLKTAANARGVKYMKDTSAKEVEGMDLYLKRSAADCTAAAPLAKKPVLAYANIMNIAEMGGAYDTRKQMLDLALLADPKNVVARDRYMHSLQPQWGGSIPEMQEFLAQAKEAGVSGHGLQRLNLYILDAVQCDQCNGTEDFAKIGTLVTGF